MVSSVDDVFIFLGNSIGLAGESVPMGKISRRLGPGSFVSVVFWL